MSSHLAPCVAGLLLARPGICLRDLGGNQTLFALVEFVITAPAKVSSLSAKEQIIALIHVCPLPTNLLTPVSSHFEASSHHQEPLSPFIRREDVQMTNV